MDFDPYEKWLDIPPGPRPPSGRALLGIADEVTDEGPIQQAAMSRYEQIRPYAASPQREIAENAHRILGEIALALTATMRAISAKPSEPDEEVVSQRPDYSAMIRKHFPERKFPHAYRDRQIGRGIARFEHLLQGDREYVVAFEGGLHATEMILLTDRACYHHTGRLTRTLSYDDIERVVATKSKENWELQINVGDRPSHQIFVSETASKIALRKLFQDMIDSGPSRPGNQADSAPEQDGQETSLGQSRPEKRPERAPESSAAQCPHCGQRYLVPQTADGKQALCKSCNQRFAVKLL